MLFLNLKVKVVYVELQLVRTFEVFFCDRLQPLIVLKNFALVFLTQQRVSSSTVLGWLASRVLHFVYKQQTTLTALELGRNL